MGDFPRSAPAGRHLLSIHQSIDSVNGGTGANHRTRPVHRLARTPKSGRFQGTRSLLNVAGEEPGNRWDRYPRWVNMAYVSFRREDDGPVK